MNILRVILAAILFFTAAAHSQTNILSDTEIQGRALAQKILAQQPTENFTNTGTLKIIRKHDASSSPISFETIITATNLTCIYECNSLSTLTVVHWPDDGNKYFYSSALGDGSMPRSLFVAQSKTNGLASADLFFPFADSDFWLCDLGLEFFHWPEQKVLKKESHRTCGCTVLESTNPNPTPESYSRVVSWIDNDSLGIVEAYAYDTNGKLLKDFYPKDFKKIRGQWQVQTLVMENVQTGSKSRIEFDLKK